MVDPMGYIPAAMTEQKRNGDLELNQFFNCFSATNEESGHQNEVNRHQGHGQYELHVFWLSECCANSIQNYIVDKKSRTE